MRIAIAGTGYVGLVTGTCFAEVGNHVTCIDIDKKKIETLRKKQITIYEPGLEVLFERNVKQGRLEFTTSLKEGIKDVQIIFLALPTPSGEDGSANIEYVLRVAEEIGFMLEKFTVIVDKSTVPVGTAEKVTEKIKSGAKVDFEVVSNPEFLREGVAVEDFMKPDRVVIGATSEKSIELMTKLYTPFVRQGNPIIFMDVRSAELTKYAANVFLATKITFINEIANLCELLGADIDKIRKGIGTDTRIGNRFLFAGIGYGGSCFPKDVQALAKCSSEVDYDFKILNSVMSVNQLQKQKMIEPLKNYFGGNLSGKIISVWGLAFKPYTDDIREAPALENITKLLSLGAKVRAYDPEAMNRAKDVLGDKIYFANDEYDALQGADALMIMTEWPVFRTPDFERISSLLKNKAIFDGRNLYDLKPMEELGFTYHSVGRKTIKQHSF